VWGNFAFRSRFAEKPQTSSPRIPLSSTPQHNAAAKMRAKWKKKRTRRLKRKRRKMRMRSK
jgi:hypothetical protein